MKIKKILSFTLVLAMLAGMIPGMSLTASAAGETNAITSPAAMGTMTIKLHIHSFTAFERGTTETTNDTIIATCTDKAHHPDGKDYTAKLTIAAPESLAYDGAAKEARVENEISGVTPDIVYEKDGASVTSVKDPGTYTASVTLGSGDDAVTASVEFTITDSRFEVTVGSVIGGSVTPDNTSAKFGETITLTANPAANTDYSAPPTFVVKDADGNDVTVENNRFTMPASDVTVTAVFARVFSEVNFSPWLGEGLPAEAGNYYLTQDVALSNTWAVPAGATSLFLNGHSISRAADVSESTKFSLITVNSGATLNLYDEDGSTGAITGGRASSGGGVYVNQGTFNMYGGAISGNTATYSGGGVYIGGGTFNMYGGTITDNESTATDSSTRGGGVYVFAGSTFAMSGGAISGNRALYGGGVFVHVSAVSLAIVNLSGNPCVKDNLSGSTPNNVYLCSYMNNVASLTIADSLEESASIGVTMQKIGVFTSGLSGKGNASNFKSDNAALYAVSENDSGEAQLVRYEHSFTYSVDGSVITATCDEANCPLPDNMATLTLTAPTAVNGKASVEANPEGIFGSTLPTVMYQTKQDDNTWNPETTSKPTEAGEHRACVTLGDGENAVTAYANYTIYPITISGDVGNTVTATKNAAMEGETFTVSVKQTIPTGYSSVSYTVEDADGNELALTGDKYTMPACGVDISVTFTAIDYTVTVAGSIANGTVTASRTTGAHVGDEITLTVTPASSYALDFLEVKDSNDQDVPVTGGKFTMPASDVTVSATFGELTAYTIFYRASGNPDLVKFRMTDSGDGNNMTNSAKLGDIDCWAAQISAVKDKSTLPVAFSTNGGSTWDTLTDREVSDDIPNNIGEGTAVIVKGEAKAFVVSFLWGDIAKNDSTGSYQTVAGGSKNFLVTNNTTSVSIPTPQKQGYDFLGWDDGSGNLKQASNGAVDISGISGTAIFTARWKLKNCTVTYDLNGGSGSAPAATVNYGESITAPANPTRDGYAFVRWVVAKSATEKVGGTETRLSAGSAFNFADTQIINDLKLKAEWKHVHSYVCLPLDHAAFNGVFDDILDYAPYVHVRICTSMDDYCAEAHSYNAIGACACGAVKPGSRVTLTQMVDDAVKSTSQVIANSVVSISAQTANNGIPFSKWQYYDGAAWKDLSTSPYTAFVIPSNLQVKAVYEPDQAKLTVNSFQYNGNLAFQFTYSVPKGMTVVDAGLLTGNNSHIGYMDAKQLTANVSGLSDIMFPYIPTTEMPIHYEPATGNAVDKFGAANVATKMFREEALNVSGRSNPIFKKVSSLGKAGTAAIAINTSADNIFYYGMGYVICRAPNKQLVAFKTDAIAATRGNPNHSAQAVINVN